MTRANEHAMPAGERREQELIEKIHTLPAHKLVLIEDFADFLCQPHEKARARKSRDCGFGGFVREGLGQPRRCRV
jgi:hypothetical protein